jgi:hypothetical protein
VQAVEFKQSFGFVHGTFQGGVARAASAVGHYASAYRVMYRQRRVMPV